MGAHGFYELAYLRTDRNGTKIYHDNNCPHCSGYGSLEKWARTGKTCFECGGSGLRPRPKIVKIYTPEHRAKLDAQKAARDAKRLVENPPPSEEKLLDAARESVLSIWERIKGSTATVPASFFPATHTRTATRFTRTAGGGVGS